MRVVIVISAILTFYKAVFLKFHLLKPLFLYETVDKLRIVRPCDNHTDNGTYVDVSFTKHIHHSSFFRPFILFLSVLHKDAGLSLVRSL